MAQAPQITQNGKEEDAVVADTPSRFPDRRAALAGRLPCPNTA
jgi:hypothetical protein